MRRTLLTGLLVLALSGGGSLAAAQVLRLPQVPRIGPRGQPPPPITIDMLRADFIARTGSDTVYFAGSNYTLDPAARATLTAQARWLRMNPMIAARIEGHADDRTPRDYALALGERRADTVRDFLLLQGVPAAQLTTTSWGKERPAVAGSSDMALALNRRVKTILMPR